jgi:hypothetical protein
MVIKSRRMKCACEKLNVRINFFQNTSREEIISELWVDEANSKMDLKEMEWEV